MTHEQLREVLIVAIKTLKIYEGLPADRWPGPPTTALHLVREALAALEREGADVCPGPFMDLYDKAIAAGDHAQARKYYQQLASMRHHVKGCACRWDCEGEEIVGGCVAHEEWANRRAAPSENVALAIHERIDVLNMQREQWIRDKLIELGWTPPAAQDLACPDAAHMAEHACANRHQCWGLCGDLGKSAEHARPAPHHPELDPHKLRAEAAAERDVSGWAPELREIAAAIPQSVHDEVAREAAAEREGADAFELKAWREMFAAFAMAGLPENWPKPALWPNKWPQDVAMVAFALHREKELPQGKPRDAGRMDAVRICLDRGCEPCAKAILAAIDAAIDKQRGAGGGA